MPNQKVPGSFVLVSAGFKRKALFNAPLVAITPLVWSLYVFEQAVHVDVLAGFGVLLEDANFILVHVWSISGVIGDCRVDVAVLWIVGVGEV